jgi:Omp85 superfamily domain
MRRAARHCLLAAVLLSSRQPARAQHLSVRPLIGGLPSESGFSAGVELVRPRVAGPVDARVKGIVSVKKYELGELGFLVPELGRRWLYLDVTGQYRNSPQEDFWGFGPDTGEDQHANFLIEAADVTGTLGATAGRVRAGLSYGFIRINTGPGRDKRFPSIPETLHAQPRYRHLGSFVEFSSVDDESDPHAGGTYAFRWTWYKSTFQRYEADLRQFIPLAAKDRVGLRVQTVFTQASSNHETPFFMLPSVGGGDTVRGFHQNRFRDRNALVLNAEYRRTLIAFLDVVAFGDAGRVFSSPGNFSLNDLALSAGIGTRLRFGKHIIFGVDVGFSREGTLLWFRGGSMF